MRRAGVVLDAELDPLRHLITRDPAREGERHVDAGGDAGRGDVLAVEDIALMAGLGAKESQFLLGGADADAATRLCNRGRYCVIRPAR